MLLLQIFSYKWPDAAAQKRQTKCIYFFFHEHVIRPLSNIVIEPKLFFLFNFIIILIFTLPMLVQLLLFEVVLCIIVFPHIAMQQQDDEKAACNFAHLFSLLLFHIFI